MKQKLPRARQCAKCPWKVSTNPYDIPNGYDRKKHCDLRKTISDGGINIDGPNHAMSCHHSTGHDGMYCIGYLHNQLGRGNNIMLRLRMLDFDLSDMKTIGEQHATFEDTLPKN